MNRNPRHWSGRVSQDDFDDPTYYLIVDVVMLIICIGVTAYMFHRAGVI